MREKSSSNILSFSAIPHFMGATDWASSSAPTDGISNYDVFLNFRGEDTRYNFTGFLHKALKDSGINVYFDSQNLWIGEAIGPALLRAIEGSKISIPIISKGFAGSQWCLRELAHIVQCHTNNSQLVLPVFFGVEPAHVRYQMGSFKEAFCKHEKKHKPDIVKSWRDALEVVGNLKGEVIDETKDQSKVVELVVKRVLGALISSTHLAESKHLIGIDSPVNDLEALLNIGSNDVRFVGICGFGGIGKTTIAKAVYNRTLLAFNKYSFLSDVRKQGMEGMDLVSLQKRLLKDILKIDIDIANHHMGKTLIEQRLSKEKVLVVLDDVDNHEQLDALAGELKWFGSGSRIIITTRDEDILAIAKDKIYKPQVLDHEQSLQLFSWHAFKNDQPLEDYMQLSQEVVRYSGGLPLTLEVMGSYLSDVSSKKVWESTLQKLKATPHEKVQRRLKISYDNLEEDQKAIFLDAACFFIGWKKEAVISILEACGYHPESDIYKLIKRSLLKFGDDDGRDSYLQMHDQIRDMGRAIVLQESKEVGERSRLWSYDKILEVLEENKGTSRIKGMSLPYGLPIVDLASEPFKMMVNLRFLEISSANIMGDISHLPSTLRCLKWASCPWIILPTNFYFKRLVYLEIWGSNIEQAWDVKPRDENEHFQKLKVLDLSFCENLSKSPEFSRFPFLERLDLGECKSLAKLDESIGQLSHLKGLTLRDCELLKKLPETIGDLKSLVKLDLEQTTIQELPDNICRLSSLKFLILKDCKSLKKLPKSIGNIKSLVELDLEQSAIEDLPDSISMLISLKKLNLRQCQSFKKLPECIGDLQSLVELDLEQAPIEDLPDNISKLISLKKLILRQCQSFKKLPESIGSLKYLVELDLEQTMIEELPSSISMLSSLNYLILKQCKSLVKLPEAVGDLKSLVELDLSITRIEDLPGSISRLSSLKNLILRQCYSFKKLPESIGDLKSLVELDLVWTAIEDLPDSISELSSLKNLILNNCHSFNRLSKSIGGLKSLVKLELQQTTIEELPGSISMLRSLKCLNLSQCESLKKFTHASGDLNSLVELDLSITGIKDLPDSISRLSSLKILILRQCYSFKMLPESIGDLKSLVELDLAWTAIEDLPDSISKLSSLKNFILKNCTSLKKLPESIGGLQSLFKLDLEWTAIEDLPSSISKLRSLKILILKQCQLVKKYPECIGDLKYLVKLDLWSTAMTELPDNISKLSHLRSLILKDCKLLQKLPESIGDLKSLVELDLEQTEIEQLPDNISKLSSLEKLILRKCHFFKKLPESIGDLKSLIKLDLKQTMVEELPGSISMLNSLNYLILKQCKSLKKLPKDIGNLKSLVELNLEWTAIEELPDNIFKLSSLKKLILVNCQSLKKLPESIGDLKSLDCLELFGCYKIEELPDGVGQLEKLEILDANNCLELVKLPRSMERMRCLHSIELKQTRISNIPQDFPMLLNLENLEMSCALKSLPADLWHLENLKYLKLLECKKLEYLPKLPSSLLELHCKECHSLVQLSDLSMLKNLSMINLDGCTKLEEIRGLEGTESLRYLVVEGCYNLTHSPRKILGQGNLSLDELDMSPGDRHYSLIATDGIYNKRLILCLVFNSPLFWNEETIDFSISVSVCQKHKKIRCYHKLIIENNEVFGFEHKIYIHYFKGFDWFGIPLEGKDAIEDLKISQPQTKFEPLYWKLLFEDVVPDQQKPSQHLSAVMVADFFNWSYVDEASSSDYTEEENEMDDQESPLIIMEEEEAMGDHESPEEMEYLDLPLIRTRPVLLELKRLC